jgi:D-hydroxyproline dehydrogenase subunit beta
VSRAKPRRCVVIGAGVLGASVAARLAQAGQHVTLLDQDRPGRATSRWSLAWLNSNNKAPRHYHDLNQAGIQAWAELAPHLDGQSWYRPVGHVELATDADELAARVQRLTGWSYPARLITLAEAAELEPSLRPPPPGTAAAWFPAEAYVLTEPLIDRLVTTATAHGATLLTGAQGRVVALDEGRVHTAVGATLETDEIICCAGRWTPSLTALASADPVPLIPWETPGATAPGLVVRISPVHETTRLIHTPQLALRPHTPSQLHLEAPDAAVDLHTPTEELHRWSAELLHRARQTLRALDNATVVDHHVCVRPMPTDGHPIVGRLPAATWLYVAVTHSAVTLAAHLSRLIAADLTATEPPDLTPYRPARFQPPALRYP